MTDRVFCDTSVLIRYFSGDDPPRAFAAAGLIDGPDRVVVSTGVLIEAAHALRTKHGAENPALARGLIEFLSRSNVELSDADQASVVLGLQSTFRQSARHIADAIIAAAAAASRCNWIATFDEKFSSPNFPSRLI